MEEKDLISVIVPVYKVERYLDRCINSIANQTYKNLEIILVDDGSPDRCPEMCDVWAKRDTRIRVIHKENGGLSSARNAGLDVAKGKYIGFVDSDDWIALDMYEYLLNLIKKTGADYSFIEMQISKPNKSRTNLQQPQMCEKVMTRDDIIKMFFRVKDENIHYCVCDKLFKREIIESIRFKEGIYFEDIDFNYKIVKRAVKAVYSNQIKYFWFQNNGSITRSPVKPRDLQLLDVWNNIVADCKESLPQYLYFANMNYKRAYMGLLGKSIKYGVSEQFVEWDITQKELVKRLRAYCKDLLYWNMSVFRKVLLLSICISPSFTRKLYGCFRTAVSKIKQSSD